MTPDNRRGAPRPERLWTEPPGSHPPEDWLRPPAPRVDERPPRAATDAATPARTPWWRERLTILLAAAGLALLGLGALGGALLLGGGSSAPDALPVSAGPAPADARSRTIRAVYAASARSVVQVRARQSGAASSGTGFAIDTDGTIVTNAHVVGDATSVRVRLDDPARTVAAEVVGRDPSSDLAVLRVSGSAAGLRPLPLADSKEVQVGDLAVAIGYPLGLDRTATAGIVSGLGREIEAPNGFSIDEVIQTDAPINPGNSGGPLLDSRGRVVGVNSQIATAGGSGNVGIGFAIPSNTVREVVPQLEHGRRIKRAFLGVTTAERTSGSGAVVASVLPGGPADDAGLRVGDVIRRVNGREVGGPTDVSGAVAALKPGSKVELQVERGGSAREVTATLGTRPERTP